MCIIDLLPCTIRPSHATLNLSVTPAELPHLQAFFAVMHPFFFSFPFLLILQYSFSNKKHFCRSLTHYPLTVLILLRLFVVEDVLYSLISMHTIQPDAPDDTEIEKKTNAPSISYFFWPSPHIQYKRHCFMTIQPADQYQSTMWFALQVTTLR